MVVDLTIIFLLFFVTWQDKPAFSVGCRSPPNQSETQKFQIDWRKQLWLTTKPEKKRNGVFWKQSEEKKLRQLGVSENTIQKLREHDWAVFNSERRYYEKWQETGTYLDEVAESDQLTEIKSVEDFLNDIENEQLYQVLSDVDRLTLQIALWKIEGYNSTEISTKCGLSVNAVNFRMWHLRKKLKNI